MTHPPQAEIETEGSRKGPGPQISLRIAWHTGLGDQSRNSSGQFGVTKGDRKRASRGSIQAPTVRHRNCVRRSKNKRDEFAQDSNADRSGKKKTRLAGCLQADTTQVHCFSGCANRASCFQLVTASDSSCSHWHCSKTKVSDFLVHLVVFLDHIHVFRLCLAESQHWQHRPFKHDKS